MWCLKQVCKKFARQEDGSTVVEAVLILPVLFWAVIAMVAYWDVFRSINVIQKAAYTVADSISRTKKDALLEGTDIMGYYDLMNFLIDQEEEAKIRVTRYSYDLQTDKYSVDWSCGVGSGMAPLTTAEITLMRPKLPVMSDDDFAILLEAKFDYKPIFKNGLLANLGLVEQDLNEFIVTRPREGKFGLQSCPVA